MPSTVLWNPAPFNAALKQAFRQAALQTKLAIDATKPQHDIPVSGPFFTDGGNRAIVRSGGLAPIFEKGASPHDIFPKGAKTSRRSKSKGQTIFKVRSIRGQTTTVLRLADGRFAAHVHHPGMAAQPFQKPQADLFPARFRMAARISLRTAAVKRAA
jgi:hypothetical protein